MSKSAVSIIGGVHYITSPVNIAYGKYYLTPDREHVLFIARTLIYDDFNFWAKPIVHNEITKENYYHYVFYMSKTPLESENGFNGGQLFFNSALMSVNYLKHFHRYHEKIEIRLEKLRVNNRKNNLLDYGTQEATLLISGMATLNLLLSHPYNPSYHREIEKDQIADYLNSINENFKEGKIDFSKLPVIDIEAFACNFFTHLEEIDKEHTNSMKKVNYF